MIKNLSDRQIEIITSYLLLAQGKKIDYNFVAFTSEINEIIEKLNDKSLTKTEKKDKKKK